MFFFMKNSNSSHRQWIDSKCWCVILHKLFSLLVTFTEIALVRLWLKSNGSWTQMGVITRRHSASSFFSCATYVCISGGNIVPLGHSVNHFLGNFSPKSGHIICKIKSAYKACYKTKKEMSSYENIVAKSGIVEEKIFQQCD